MLFSKQTETNLPKKKQSINHVTITSQESFLGQTDKLIIIFSIGSMSYGFIGYTMPGYYKKSNLYVNPGKIFNKVEDERTKVTALGWPRSLFIN